MYAFYLPGSRRSAKIIAWEEMCQTHTGQEFLPLLCKHTRRRVIPVINNIQKMGVGIYFFISTTEIIQLIFIYSTEGYLNSEQLQMIFP